MPLIIKIELDDPAKCDGCPAFISKKNNAWGPYKLWGKKCTQGHGNWVGNLDLDKYNRPQVCIDQHSHYHKEAVEEVLEQFDSYKNNCIGCKKKCNCVDIACDSHFDCGELDLVCREKLKESAEELDG